ncbi:ATP-dependent RNA helicase HrpA [Pseudomarimonas arenosa]|uniref:ATP-dependent RNA helicase HrpA n=1 Tax=Pseudomarimonas arenosa TaxID=2774145 RepID=A0AAW3ZNN6_9GAMM|nr:ATP-dependent RNA helicase HrpA [Pseudomarimonas arenosa]MBD8527120.1 ATP-dependent RNA helicase HrpA [Pseudomarimonas arenosa]
MKAMDQAVRRELGRARRDIEQGLSRDRGRLHRLWSKWSERPEEAARRQAFEQLLEGSKAARQRRVAAMPAIRLADDLPVSREAEAIIEAIQQNQVLVVAGETGSGKTTQLPKLAMAAGCGAAGMIGCTQPRRIAARSVARRVAEELNAELGSVVGFQVRFTEQVREDTVVKFMTDGILLAEIQSDRYLSRYDTLILDEAHERSLNIDFLLGYLKGLLRKRRDLKLIVTSATIDTERFAQHFEGAPVINVEGRSYPVELRYRPLEAAGEIEDESGETVREARSVTEAIVAAADEITREDPHGDVLIFLPGEREIREVHRALERRLYKATEVLPLYARLSARDQDRVFRPGPGRRIVLATNVAETSLTVPRIRYVIDPGLARVKRYSPRQKLDRLHIEPISRASADQRKGRCGRVAAGVCYRLYSEPDYLARPLYTDPEIRRSALAGVILRMLSLGLGQIDRFAFIDEPDSRAIAEGWQQLDELGAVDKQKQLTATGRAMAKLPIDVKLARMLIAAVELGAVSELLIIASFLSIQDPRERPVEARGAADSAHGTWADERSEFVAILNLWKAYQHEHAERTQSGLRQWCEKHFLSFLRMREWRELHRQLLLLAQEQGWTLSAEAADYAALHKAIICGVPMQIGQKNDKHLFDAPRQRRFAVFPGSRLAKRPPNWLMAAVLLDIHKVYAMTVAKIEPEWVIEQLPHLLSRKHFDPHWSRAQGRVVGFEQISLFGLLLQAKRPIHYGGLYPQEAHQIFVQQALVTGEINTRLPFIERNLKMLDKAREEEAKLRRVGLVADEEWQARWYLDRIPPEINSAVGLDAWHKRLNAQLSQALEWNLADLLPGEGSEQDRFPKFWPLAETRLRLHYAFEPGQGADGVTLEVPLHLLGALDEARLSWLVPGFVEDKATALIRGLPKQLRRNFVPAPDFARAFAEAFPQPGADALVGELARFLRRLTGVEIQASDFDEAAVAEHLRMNLRLLARDGRKALAESRDLAVLRQRFAEQAERAFAARVAKGMEALGLIDFPEQGVPEQVVGEAGVPAFPALVDQGESVSLQVRADRDEASALHAQGVRRLMLLALAPKIKQARKQLPIDPKIGLLYAAIESQERLRGDLVEAAVNALCADGLQAIRTAAAFATRLDEVQRNLFAAAVERLRLAEQVLAQYAELKPLLEPELVGFARANFDDLRAQLQGLMPPGFLRDTPAEHLQSFPRYLKAMRLRVDRLNNDPPRDQQKMLEVQPFTTALERLPADRPGRSELRWALEELRVSLFAQELGTREPISTKRVAKLLERLLAD